MKLPLVRRPVTRIVLVLYAIGVATALGIAVSWFVLHTFVRVKWPAANAFCTAALRDLDEDWSSSRPERSLARLPAFIEVSLYDTRGSLVTSKQPRPLPPPTPEEQRASASGLVQRRNGGGVIRVSRGDTVLGYAVFDPTLIPPPLWGVLMDLVLISSWICIVGLLIWRTMVRPLQRIANAAEAFGKGDMSARTGVARHDEIGRVASAFDDMSDRISLSREAERELLASVSHELRTPLTRIRVAVDLAEEGDAETARASLADVAEDLTELETLMTNIFSTTRLRMAAATRDDQPVPLQRTDVDLPALVEKAVVHLRHQHPDRPYTLELQGEPRARCIYADAVLVRRAIENLLENAHKYSPPGAPVTVVVNQADDAFRIAVIDRGFGIGPGDLKRVFTPFFRTDRSRSRSTGGVGLGLALAKRVIEAHDGTISLSSEIDAGTTVALVLPIATAPREVESQRHIS